MAAGQTLGESIRLLPRFMRITNESACWSVAASSDNANDAVMKLRYIGLLRRNLKHATEYHVAGVLQNLRKFVGRDVNPAHVSFIHLRKSGIRPFERYFGCPVEFGADSDRMVLSKSALGMPNFRADSKLCELLQHLGDEETRRRVAQPQSFRQAVDNALFTSLTRGEPKQERVAEALGVSPRTLVRRLAEEGTSFTELLDKLRRSLADQYLNEAGTSIEQIALLLGYSEIGCFTHAFRRWHGVAPSEVKAD